jgi:CheY-like chemotaxis protein
MSILRGILVKLGLHNPKADRGPITVFLLDDDRRRHRWFEKRFKGDMVDIAENVAQAIELLVANSYDAVFLDHDLLPQHYKSSEPDDENTGFAVALWLSQNPKIQSSSKVIVHTRNADAAIRMVETLRNAGRNAEYVPFPLLEFRIKHYWN